MTQPLAVYIREQLILAGKKLKPYSPAEVAAFRRADAAYAKSPKRLVMPWEAPGRRELWGLRHEDVVL